jgi:hypothetical protein
MTAPCILSSSPSSPPAQLPALIKPAGALTPASGGALIPILIANAGDQASWRYVEFFTADIRHPNTRRAYARACGDFLAWCEARGLTLPTIRPMMSLYI